MVGLAGDLLDQSLFGRCQGSLNASVSKSVSLLGTVCCTCGLLALYFPKWTQAPFTGPFHAALACAAMPIFSTMLVITNIFISVGPFQSRQLVIHEPSEQGLAS